MGIQYYPVITHTWDTRKGTEAHAYENADRFEKLNGIRPKVLLRDEMNSAGVKPRSGYWYPFWVWDFVPDSAEYILVYDSFVLPIKPLPELPALKFAAAPDRKDKVKQGRSDSAIVKRTGKYFQMQLFVAHRDTRPYFDAAKELGELDKHNLPDGRGFDGRGHMTAMNDAIQANVEIYELPKLWNWIATYEKEFIPTDPIMMNCTGQGTWAYWVYTKQLLEQLESHGIYQ